MRFVLLLAAFPFVSAQTPNVGPTPSVAPLSAGAEQAPAPGTTTNYYIATNGSDANPCTSGSKCLTLQHTLTLLPTVLAQNYIINVADGTYAEPIDLSGYISGGYTGANLKILGDNAAPANVVFTGTVSKTLFGVATTTGVFTSGPLFATLQGLKINVTALNGITCQSCASLILDNVQVTGTLSNTGINAAEGGHLFFQDAVTVSGFNTSNGLGVDIHGGSYGTMPMAGTLTVTGPGGASTTSVCIVIEHQSGFTLSQSTPSFIAAAITLSGCQVGINIAGHSGMSNFGSTGNISITNGSTTPAGSVGISVNNSSAYDMTINGNTLTIDHYTNCMTAGTLSEITIGTGGRTFTNCTFVAGNQCVQGSVCTLF